MDREVGEPFWHWHRRAMTELAHEAHARVIARAKAWHTHAPDRKTLHCPHCRADRPFAKSRWVAGRYRCELCGWHVDEPY
jgi:transposase-like protein